MTRITYFLAFAALAVLVWVVGRGCDVPPEAETHPVRTVAPPPPVIETPSSSGTVAVAGLESPTLPGRIPRVRVENADRVTAAVHVEGGDEDIVLLADRPARRFLPELRLKRGAPGFRVLQGDPRRVTVTEQRMPIVAPELRFYGGASLSPALMPDRSAYGFTAAATVVRVWFVHLGGAVTYAPAAEKPVTAAPLAAVDVFDGWYVGVDLSGRASILRRF